MEEKKFEPDKSKKTVLIDNDEKINIQGNTEEMGDYDKYWVKENKGNQTADIKFPTFHDNNIGQQLREDISFDHLTDDINSIIELLLYFEKAFLSLLKSNNKAHILTILAKYSLNHVNFIAYSVLSRRQITLVFYMIKLKYEGANNNLLNAIETEYKNADPHKIIEEIYTLISTLEINKDDEVFSQVESLVKKNIENEGQIYESECKPSIVGISIAMKFFKTIIEIAISDINQLHHLIKEEVVINFLHTVLYLLN